MIPTTAQREALSTYLYKNLRYRETFTEFYDHILSALENVPTDLPFMTAVDEVVVKDFGGYNGMTTIETCYYRTITKEVRQRFFTRLIAYFKFPLIGVTALLAAAFYYLVKQPSFGFMESFLMIVGMRLIPSFLKIITNFKLGHFFSRPKRSVKDGAFQWLDYLPGAAFVFIIIWHSLDENSPMTWLKNAGPGFSTFLLLGCALHTLCYYQVYQEEFKPSITQ